MDAELLASETLEGCMEGIRPSTNLSQTARTQSGDADSAAGTSELSDKGCLRRVSGPLVSVVTTFRRWAYLTT